MEVTLDRVAPNQGSFQTQFYGREKKMELKSQEDVDQVLSAIRTAPLLGEQDQAPGQEPCPGASLHHLHPPAGGLPEAEHDPPGGPCPSPSSSTRGVDIEGEGDRGSHHVHAYRLPAAVRRGRGRRPGLCRGPVWPGVSPPTPPGSSRQRPAPQDAHEAIRPSNVDLTPESVRKSLTLEQYRLYKLIWSRFLACQMASAVYDSLGIEVTSAGYVFKASRSEVKFPGFLAVYEEGKDEEGGGDPDPPAQPPGGGAPHPGGDQAGAEVHPAPPPGIPRPPSSGPWRRRGSAGLPPTPPPSPPSWLGNTW